MGDYPGQIEHVAAYTAPGKALLIYTGIINCCALSKYARDPSPSCAAYSS